jgi:crotonobetainyl-CoA:carnitine CoA-transferase CaiB-like acyl-CoA transferase
VEKLDAAEVPGGPVFGYGEIMQDAHIKARNMVVDMDHPIIGRMKTIGLPIKSTGELTAIRKPAPWLGQHSAEVLRTIGYADVDIDALFAGGVVYDKYREKAAMSA